MKLLNFFSQLINNEFEFRSKVHFSRFRTFDPLIISVITYITTSYPFIYKKKSLISPVVFLLLVVGTVDSGRRASAILTVLTPAKMNRNENRGYSSILILKN
jgi:hypothetical protein